VAGPKTLEHLVDVVLYLEGERFSQNRILRSIKNRFGTTDEIGIFEMMENGLIEVKDPSQIFLHEFKPVAGCVVTCLMEGSRPILAEVQALTNPTNFGYPQRRVNGFDLNRLQLIIAVISRRTSINLSNYDIFVNFVGGMETKEPAADLAVALAIITSVKNLKLDEKYCIFGELGLSGEIRRVTKEKKRTVEAKRFNFTKFIQNKNINHIIKEIQNV
jgi:DNA repair protein RadA/Sms